MLRRHLPACTAPISMLCAIMLLPSVAAGQDLKVVGSDAFTSAIGTIDRTTAEWTLIGPAGQIITGLAYDPNHDVLYGVSPSTDSLYTIDQSTGEATLVGKPGELGYENVNGLAYDPNNDILYATDNNTNTLFQIDTKTGIGTEIAVITGGFTEIEGLAYEPSHDVLYGITQLQLRVVSIDVHTGEATGLFDPLPEETWRGLTWDSVTGYLFLSAVNIFSDASIYSFNPDDGRLEFVGHTTGIEAVQGLAVMPKPTPPCPADLNGDGVVDVLDLLELLAAWGPC